MRPDLLSRDSEVGIAYAADPLIWHGGFKRHTLEAIRAALERFSRGEKLEALPVLWLHGTDDKLVPTDGTRQGITGGFGANVSSHLFPGAHHELFNETNAQEVIAILAGFLSEPAGSTIASTFQRNLTRAPS